MIKENVINDGLPEELYAMLTMNFYDEEDQKANSTFCSVSDLLNPPKLYWLKKKYGSIIKTKASDSLWTTFGSVFHELVEKALSGNDDYVLEKRIYKEFEINGKKLILSGKFDIYKKSTRSLKDVKTTSIYKILDLIDDKEDKYPLQTNIYAFLMNDEYPVDDISILFFAKDHDKRKAKYDPKYPQLPVGEVSIGIWSERYTERLIEKLLTELDKYSDTDVDLIPPCPSHERYQDMPKLAFYGEDSLTLKNTIKKASNATKLFNSLSELTDFINLKKPTKFGVEFRPLGEPKRCTSYCNYNIYCNFYKKHVLGNELIGNPSVEIVITEKTSIYGTLSEHIALELKMKLTESDYNLITKC